MESRLPEPAEQPRAVVRRSPFRALQRRTAEDVVAWRTAVRELRRRRTVEDVVASNRPAPGGTSRTLGRHHLVLIGFAVLIGAGIFRLTARSIAHFGGANTVAALVVAGVSFFATALCYAEFASTVPVAGSAFTYAQAGIGLGPAWVIGGLLLIEYAVGAAAVSVNLVDEFLAGLSWSVPAGWTSVLAGGVIVVFGMFLGLGGLGRRSARVIVVATYVKLLCIAVLVVGGVVLVASAGVTTRTVALPRPSPPDAGSVASALAVVFFAYAGFDAVTTAADEATYPRRDLPRAMLYALSSTIAIYLALAGTVAAVGVAGPDCTGDAPSCSIATILVARGEPVLATVARWGSVLGLATVTYVLLYGLSRIMTAMWRQLRDGSGPGRDEDDGGSSSAGLVVVAVALVVLPIALSVFGRDGLTEVVNTATALAFSIVVVATVALRRSRPDLLRTFQVPLLPLVAVVALFSDVVVMSKASPTTWGVIAAVVSGVLVIWAVAHLWSTQAAGPPPEDTAGDAPGAPWRAASPGHDTLPSIVNPPISVAAPRHRRRAR